MVIHCAKLTTRNHKKGQQIATFFKRSRKSSVPSLWRRTIASKVFNSNHMFCWENDADAKYLFSVGLRGGLWPFVPCNLTNVIVLNASMLFSWNSWCAHLFFMIVETQLGSYKQFSFCRLFKSCIWNGSINLHDGDVCVQSPPKFRCFWKYSFHFPFFILS